MSKFKKSLVSAFTLHGLLIKALLYVAEWKAKKTPAKWDDKLIKFLKQLL